MGLHPPRGLLVANYSGVQVAFLRVIQGGRPGELHEISSDRLVLGRHPSCEVVLDNAVISRQHARLVRQGESYAIEDLGSRNGTYVNGRVISGIQRIADRDHIRICDYVLEYLDQLPLIDSSPYDPSENPTNPVARSSAAGTLQPPDTLDDAYLLADVDSSSSIITTLKARGRSERLGVRPEAKLRAVLDLSRQLSHTLDLTTMLEETLTCLFSLFPQAEYGVIVLCDAEFKDVELRVARSRQGEGLDDMAISRTILGRALLDHEAILSEDLADDTRFRDSNSASAMQIRSLICAPLSGAEEKPFGVIQLTTRNLKQIFTQDDLDLLVSVAAQAGLAVENTKLHAAAVKKFEIERDLEVATQIQLGFLPNQMPNIAGYEFNHYYRAAQQVGGDYFDYIPLPDGRLAVTVGDVSGKGVPAALLMARLCSSVRFHLVAQPTAAEAMTALNRELIHNALGFRFITLVIAVVTPGSPQVTLVNAGHLPPLLHGAQGSRYMEGEYSGLPLGISENTIYHEHVIQLAPNDSLLLYTDGITETPDAAENLYGRDRLLLAKPEAPCRAENLITHVLNDVSQFSSGEHQWDDRCLVAIHALETK